MGDSKEIFQKTDITASNYIGERIKDSEVIYHQLFSLVADAIFLIDNESGQIIEVNEAATNLYGYSREELLTMKNTSLSAEPDQTLMATNKGLTSIPIRWHQKKDGSPFPVEITAKHFSWHGRGVHIAAIRDITGRIQAEESLKESEQRYREIFENSSDGIFLLDVLEGNKFKIIRYNPAEEKAIGFRNHQVSGKLVDEVFSEKLAKQLNDNYRKCCEKGTAISYEECLELPSGSMYFQTSLIPIKGPQGKINRIVGIARDITELKKNTKGLKHRIALEEAIGRSSRLFISPDCNLHRVLEILGEAVAVNRAYIFGFRNNGSKMDNLYEWCSDGTEPQIDTLQDLDSDMFPWWIGKLNHGESIVIENVDTLPSIAKTEKYILQAQGICSLLAVPIYSTEGKLNGYMGFDDTEKHREWSDEDVNALRVIAEMVGVYWGRLRAEKALQDTNRLLQQIIESFPDATLVIDDKKNVIAWNRAMEKMTGIKKETMLGKGDYAYSVPFYGKKRPMLIDYIFTEKGEKEDQEKLIERKGKALYTECHIPALNYWQGAFVSATASPLFDSKEKIIGAIESIRDITERKAMEERLQYLATHDALTNIPNRHYLEETLKRAAIKAKRGQKSALLLIDLDNFKMVNDTLGHTAGDELLIVVAGTIKRNLREGDFLARLGGDEFAVLLEGITEQDAGALADRLRMSICESQLCLNSHQLLLNLSISIGIVIIDGTADYHRYLSLADAALYSAKAAGRNRIVNAKLNEDKLSMLTETNQIIGLIKRALHHDLFELVFQPVAQFSNGKIIHHEALIRLRDKNGQMIFPSKIIPVAEQFGFMSHIDIWVVKSALAIMAEFPELKLFINISGVTLGDTAALDEIEASIINSGIEPCRIGFEITETAAVKDILRAERWVSKIKGLGCLIALDDFGTGFSSFSYLRMLPVDYIKIDGSFVLNIDKDPVNRAFIQAIHTIASTLGMQTIAEFVENQEILKSLEELGIDYGQGFFLGKPQGLSL